MIQIRPGVLPNQAAAALVEVSREAANVTGSAFGGMNLFNGYLAFALNAERRLSAVVSDRALDDLIRSRRYWLLFSSDPTSLGNNLGRLVEAELSQLVTRLDAAAAAVGAESKRWGEGQNFTAIIVDTNVLMYHLDELAAADWVGIFDLDPWRVVVVVLTTQVLNELDNLKDRGHDDARRRARAAIHWVEDRFKRPDASIVLQDGEPRVWARLMLDEPDHAPLPVGDAEIVDRALSLNPYVPELGLITRDVGMVLRARNAGLLAERFPGEGAE